MKNKPPRDERSFSTDRVVGANRIFERDVLLSDGPRKEPRVRASIIGDKKLTARDSVTRRNASDTSKSARGVKPERGLLNKQPQHMSVPRA